MAANPSYDVLLRGGHVICPASKINGIMDVAVKDGRIKPGQLLLMEAMGGGLTWGAAVLRL